MLSRKQLPNFGYLKNRRFDIQKIVEHCESKNLFDYSQFGDINVSSNSAMAGFVIANSFSKTNFFTEESAAPLEGECYKQLYLTEYKGKLKRASTEENSLSTIYSRTRRLNPNHSTYDPIADELNYGQYNQYVEGIFKTILSSFIENVTRVRLAYLAPNFSIKPHVDYDPQYIVRYHIPIRTSNLCTMHVKERGIEHSIHFPADGRVYFLNAGKVHWAQNLSSHDRLHLIVDTHGQRDLVDNLVAL